MEQINLKCAILKRICIIVYGFSLENISITLGTVLCLVRCRHGCDHIIGFTTTYAISALMLSVRISIREKCTTSCDKVCQ